MITVNTWFYVATTGNDSTGNGTAGSPWATVQHALNYLGNYWIAANVQATVVLQNGVYTLTSPITVPFHPQGAQINISGLNTYTPTLVNCSAVSGVSSPVTVTLTLSTLTNIAVGDYVQIPKTCTGAASNYQFIWGCHQITAIGTSTSPTITFPVYANYINSNIIGTGTLSGTVTIVPVSIVAPASADVIDINATQFGTINDVVLVNNNTGNMCVHVNQNAVATIGWNCALYGAGIGVYGSSLSIVYFYCLTCIDRA